MDLLTTDFNLKVTTVTSSHLSLILSQKETSEFKVTSLLSHNTDILDLFLSYVETNSYFTGPCGMELSFFLRDY